MATQDSGMGRNIIFSFTDAKVNTAAPGDVRVPQLVSDELWCLNLGPSPHPATPFEKTLRAIPWVCVFSLLP